LQEHSLSNYHFHNTLKTSAGGRKSSGHWEIRFFEKIGFLCRL